MIRNSFLVRYEPFIAGAVLGAHANTLQKGFRQSDVRFLIEIFTNWISSAEEHTTLPIQNTQIARYVDNLVNEGFARKIEKRSYPVYRVTRTGLIDLISRIVERDYYTQFEHFYFIHFFISSYRTRIISFVKAEGKRFPYSLQQELEALLDPETLVNRQFDGATRALKRVDSRIKDAQRTFQIVQAGIKNEDSFEQIMAELDKQAAVGINEHRRYSQVFSVGTRRQVLWELQMGSMLRSKRVWEPSRRGLELHIQELTALKDMYKAERDKSG